MQNKEKQRKIRREKQRLQTNHCSRRQNNRNVIITRTPSTIERCWGVVVGLNLVGTFCDALSWLLEELHR